jgi:hypothetical protein
MDKSSERVVAVSYICHDGVAGARSESRATRMIGLGTPMPPTSVRVAENNLPIRTESGSVVFEDVILFDSKLILPGG